MELNVEEQTEKLQGEGLEFTNQLGMIRQQVSLWQGRERAIQLLLDKNTGAQELLQSLTPEEKPDTVKDKE